MSQPSPGPVADYQQPSQQYQQAPYPQQQYQEQPQYQQPIQQTVVVVQQAPQPQGIPRYQVEYSSSICTNVCTDTPSCCGSCYFPQYTLATISYRIGGGFCLPFCCGAFVGCCIYDDLAGFMGLQGDGVFIYCLLHYFCCTSCCMMTKANRSLFYYTLAGMPKHSNRIRITPQGTIM